MEHGQQIDELLASAEQQDQRIQALHDVAQVYQIIWLIAIVMFSIIPLILQGNTI